MSELEQRTHLSKSSQIVASHAVEELILNTFAEARKNEILQFKDSFGANHSLDSAGITVAWAYSIWDVNDDSYKYENDLEEPVSF